ncbi:MAG: HD domain-containing protein [Anoxybacillus gonensis]|nr:HD domain-containing protein [Anoxybacillus gonensis]
MSIVFTDIYVLKKQPLTIINTILISFFMFIALLLLFRLSSKHFMIAITLYALWHPMLFHISYHSLQKVIERDVFYFFKRGYQSALMASDLIHLSQFQKMIHYGIGMIGIVFAYILFTKHFFIQNQMSVAFLFTSFVSFMALIAFYIGISYIISKQINHTFHRLRQQAGHETIPNIYVDEMTILVHALNIHNDKTRRILSLLAEIEGQSDECKYIAEHSRRVANYCLQIGKHIGLLDDQLNNLYHAALLHDIGKIGIPDYILLKKGPLSKDEFSIIKQYPMISYLLTKAMFQTANKDLLYAILYHKEYVDGTGYPYQINHEEIPLLAKIISVADAFDTMLSFRPYRNNKSELEAIRILREESGTKWDAEIVHIFTHLLTKKEINMV